MYNSKKVGPQFISKKCNHGSVGLHISNQVEEENKLKIYLNSEGFVFMSSKELKNLEFVEKFGALHLK